MIAAAVSKFFKIRECEVRFEVFIYLPDDLSDIARNQKGVSIVCGGLKQQFSQHSVNQIGSNQFGSQILFLIKGDDSPQCALHEKIIPHIKYPKPISCEFPVITQCAVPIKVYPQEFPVFILGSAIEMVLLTVDKKTLSLCDGICLPFIFQIPSA